MRGVVLWMRGMVLWMRGIARRKGMLKLRVLKTYPCSPPVVETCLLFVLAACPRPQDMPLRHPVLGMLLRMLLLWGAEAAQGKCWACCSARGPNAA